MKEVSLARLTLSTKSAHGLLPSLYEILRQCLSSKVKTLFLVSFQTLLCFSGSNPLLMIVQVIFRSKLPILNAPIPLVHDPSLYLCFSLPFLSFLFSFLLFARTVLSLF